MVKLISCLTILFLAQNSISKNNTSSSKNKFIGLSVKLSADTVYTDSIFVLTVVFENKTDSSVLFYPNALLSIVKPSGGFEYESYFLNKALDLTHESIIAPRGGLKQSFRVKAIPPVFTKGMNFLRVYYLCSIQNGYFTKHNKLHGNLESSEFKLFVK